MPLSSLCTNHTEDPKTLKSGSSWAPYHNECGESVLLAEVPRNSSICAACIIACPQHRFGSPAPSIIERAISSNVRFALSATPFCSLSPGSDFSGWMPRSAQTCRKPFINSPKNSPPKSERILSGGRPIIAIHCFKCNGYSSLDFSLNSHFLRVKSSTKII